MSIPINELTKLTNDPEVQKNIQIFNQILLNFHTGLVSFFNQPEVQQTFIAIQNAAIKFDKYLNDPVVQKNLKQFSKLIMALSNDSSFQQEYIKRRAAAPIEEEIEETFGDLIVSELSLPEQLNHLHKNDDKSNPLKIIILIFSLIFNLYINNLDEFKDFTEAYNFYINEVEAKAVTISRINLREAPTFKSDSLMVIPRNSILKVYKESNNGWIKVSFNQNNLDIEGYISEAYVKKIKNNYDLEVILDLDKE